MYDIFIIFPIHLFNLEEYPIEAKEVYLCLDPYFIGRPGLHPLKIKYHKDTMGRYLEHVKGRHPVTFFGPDEADLMWEHTAGTKVALYDPIEHELGAKVAAMGAKHGAEVTIIDAPYFPETKTDLKKFVEEYGQDGPWRHDSQFYRWQRRRLNVLMGGPKGGPLGGQWSYDRENRVGRLADPIPAAPEPLFPIDHEGARAATVAFIEERLALFGKYEDLVSKDMDIGWHSCLSCVLNVGLITPAAILGLLKAHCDRHGIRLGGGKVVNWAGKAIRGTKKGPPIEALEGFVRQLIGWRSFCHLVYEYRGEEMRKANIFGHHRRMTRAWWEGQLGIEPVDHCIRKVARLAYCHHIERLMYLGAFMLLCEIDPHQVFDWFITQCAIDAYDWVMVPNIYGMSQFSAGPIMMTRPYFSSSNYVRKMSDFGGGQGGSNEDWGPIWDALYYNFIDKNQEMLGANYSTANAVRLWTKKAPSEQRKARSMAQSFINSVTIGKK